VCDVLWECLPAALRSPVGRLETLPLDKACERRNKRCVSSSSQRLPHTIIALVQDRPGVLQRVATCCAEKGWNIRSLAVGSSEQAGLSRMTFVVDASTDALEMVGELQKLDDVREIMDISAREFVSRELALVRVQGGKEMRKRLMEIVDIFHASIIDVSANSMIIEVTGHENTIDSLVRLLKDYGVVELVRTGRVSMLRGS
jgi:acetolactate synthase-1/3 small subunit